MKVATLYFSPFKGCFNSPFLFGQWVCFLHSQEFVKGRPVLSWRLDFWGGWPFLNHRRLSKAALEARLGWIQKDTLCSRNLFLEYLVFLHMTNSYLSIMTQLRCYFPFDIFATSPGRLRKLAGLVPFLWASLVHCLSSVTGRITFIEHILCVRHLPGWFKCVISFNHLQNALKWCYFSNVETVSGRSLCLRSPSQQEVELGLKR